MLPDGDQTMRINVVGSVTEEELPILPIETQPT